MINNSFIELNCVHLFSICCYFYYVDLTSDTPVENLDSSQKND